MKLIETKIKLSVKLNAYQAIIETDLRILNSHQMNCANGVSEMKSKKKKLIKFHERNMIKIVGNENETF